MSSSVPSLATATAHRYVQPLREGGSLPAVVDTDDGLYVVKFRGAGQGAKALVAELVVGVLAGCAQLPVPRLALVNLPEPFGRSEPDPEIQDILRASLGVNVGLRFLDGAFNFARAAAGDLVSPEFASALVWFDALVTNPDRTHRNTNLLVWNRRLWLIDHGASLYVHHDWSRAEATQARSPFPLIRDHVLLADASKLEEVDAELAPRMDAPTLEQIMAAVPDSLLMDAVRGPEFASAAAARARYVEFLVERLRPPRMFLAAALEARQQALAEAPQHLSARR